MNTLSRDKKIQLSCLLNLSKYQVIFFRIIEHLKNQENIIRSIVDYLGRVKSERDENALKSVKELLRNLWTFLVQELEDNNKLRGFYRDIELEQITELNAKKIVWMMKDLNQAVSFFKLH